MKLDKFEGCGDSLCKLKKPVGMHTNGGCRCLRKPMAGEMVAKLIKLARAAAKVESQWDNNKPQTIAEAEMMECLEEVFGDDA